MVMIAVAVDAAFARHGRAVPAQLRMSARVGNAAEGVTPGALTQREAASVAVHRGHQEAVVG